MASVWGELKRRSVVKVGAAYAIVAWLLIQVADVVLPALQAPEWTISFVTVLLVLGFPITLIMAWAYEMTPEGLKPDAEVGSSGSIARATGQKLNYLIVGLLVLLGVLVTDRYVLDSGMRASAAGARTPVVGISSAPDLLPALMAASAPPQRHNFKIGRTTRMGASAAIDAEMAISADGTRLVFAAYLSGSEGVQLYSRTLDQFDALPMPGTESSRIPFLSPDGDWAGFGSGMGTALTKVSTRGGPAITLTDEIGLFYGGSWGADDTIVFSTSGGGGDYLASVSAAGGTPRRLTTPEPGTLHRWPDVLPGEGHVLFTISEVNGQASEGSVALLSMETGEYRALIPGAFNARYAPTGHIVFARAGSLWAVPFDLESLELEGTPTPLVDGVQMNTQSGHAPYGFSDDGVLVYVRGEDQSGSAGRSLVWVDRDGREEALEVPVAGFFNPRLSPDGRKLAITVGDMIGTDMDIWIYDLERGTESRLTFDSAANETNPVWTPDGLSLVYFASGEEAGIFRKRADGTGQEERLTTSDYQQLPESFTPDGGELVLRAVPLAANDLHVLPMDGEKTASPLLDMTFSEAFSAISPDGRWIAYSSNETGLFEVYVRPFPNVDDGKWQISTNGGVGPRWGAKGTELFYRAGTGNNKMMMIDVEGVDPFSPGSPAELFSGAFFFDVGTVPSYDVSLDGQRFLMMKNTVSKENPDSQTSIAIVNNWFEELRRVVRPVP